MQWKTKKYFSFWIPSTKNPRNYLLLRISVGTNNKKKFTGNIKSFSRKQKVLHSKNYQPTKSYSAGVSWTRNNKVLLNYIFVVYKTAFFLFDTFSNEIFCSWQKKNPLRRTRSRRKIANLKKHQNAADVNRTLLIVVFVSVWSLFDNLPVMFKHCIILSPLNYKIDGIRCSNMEKENLVKFLSCSANKIFNEISLIDTQLPMLARRSVPSKVELIRNVYICTKKCGIWMNWTDNCITKTLAIKFSNCINFKVLGKLFLIIGIENAPLNPI